MADLSEYIGMDWVELARKLGWIHSMSKDVPQETATATTTASKVEHDGMRLQKEDMPLFGLCPARDEFYLVVCEKCGQLVKPHAFQHHIVLRHQPGSNVNIGRPTVALSLQVCRQSDGNALASSLARSAAGKQANVFRGRPVKPAVVKKPGVGRSARGGHRSLARAGILAVDSDRTRVTVSVDCIAIGPAPDFSRQLTTSSNQLASLTSLTPSMRDSLSKKLSLSSASSSSALTLTSMAINRLHSSPALIPGDEPPQVLPAVAVISQPLDQTRMTSSPNNSDTPPPTLDVCSNAIPGGTLVHDTRQSISQTPLIDRLIADGVKSQSAMVKLTETLLATKASNLSGAESQLQVISNAKLISPPSLSSAVMYSGRTGLSLNASTKPVVNIPTLSTPKSRKSSCSQKFVLCKDREFDPNKHCGVWISDAQKPCTRSLTCKTHSRSLRRAVSGRSKQFDVLLQEQRERRRNVLCRDAVLVTSSAKHVPSEKPVTSAHAVLPRYTMLSETARTPSSLVSGGVIRHIHPTLAGSAGTIHTIQPVSAKSAETIRQVPASIPVIGSINIRSASVSTAGSGAGRLVNQLATSYTGTLRVGNAVAGNIQRSISLDGSGVPQVTLKSVNSPVVSKLDPFAVKTEPVVISDEDNDDSYRVESKAMSPVLSSVVTSGMVASGTNLPRLTCHPRPLAVNGFGSWLHGDGCYVFNRSSDACRSALLTAVEGSLQPPPHKKLCVESNLKVEIKTEIPGTPGEDPYEFSSLASRLVSELSTTAVSVSTHSKPTAILNAGRRRTSDTSDTSRQVVASPVSVSAATVQYSKERISAKDVVVTGSTKLTAGPWLVKTQTSTAFNGRLVNLPVGHSATSQPQQVSQAHTVTLVQGSHPVSMLTTSQPVTFVRASQPVNHVGTVQQPRGVINASQAVSLLGTSQRATFTLQPVRPGRAVTNNSVTNKTLLPVGLTVAASSVLTQPGTIISTPPSIRPMPIAALPNGAFNRVQKPAGTFSSEGSFEGMSTRQQSVTTLLSLDKKPVMASSSAPIGIILAAPIVTTWPMPAGDKDGMHRVISQLPGSVADSTCRVIASTSQQRSQLSYIGPVVDRRPMIISKLRLNQGSGIGDVSGSCGQNSSVATLPGKLLLHSVVGGGVGDTAAHIHHQRKVNHQTAANSVSSGADSNVLS